MKKYNEKLIEDYVLGNDIEDYDIVDLENDFDFMYDVLIYTKDTEMFNFCSDELKNNVRFLREVLDIFKDDKKIVLKLVNPYIQNLMKKNEKVLKEDEICHNELLILASSILEGSEFDDAFYINYYAGEIYKQDIAKINEINKNFEKYGLTEDIGLGFIYILTKYNNSTIMNEFYAEGMINSLFYNDSNYTYEQLIHLSTCNKEAINGKAVNKFILDYIFMYDKNLGNYAAKNMIVLTKLRKSIKVVYENWDNYIENLNSRRALIVGQELEDFVTENKIKASYSLYDMIDEIMFELGYSENRANDIETIQNILQKSDKTMSSNDIKLINYITELVKELYSRDVIDKNANFDKIKEKCENGKVLVLDNHKK